MARGQNLRALRARYEGVSSVTKPGSTDEQHWTIFTSYIFERRPLKEIGKTARMTIPEVRRVLLDVDGQVMPVMSSPPHGKTILLESPVEDLALSLRARNALRNLGCATVRDVLPLDLKVQMRGIGRKTRDEVLAALRKSGLAPPKPGEPSESENRNLDRRLERMHHRIGAALASVMREITSVQKKLRKRTERRNCGPAEQVTSM